LKASVKPLNAPRSERQFPSVCGPCVYFSKNLDPSYCSSNMPSQHSCGLDFIPGDDKCNEMRTNNCGMRKKLMHAGKKTK